MRPRSLTIRIIAFLLMLVFTQKTGAGLFLHNIFHGATSSPKAGQPVKSNEISYACTCLDDLQLPFEEAQVQEDLPVLPIYGITTPFFVDGISLHTLIHFSLRGPPADLS